ncbi:MAG: hypothetical protein L3K26_12015 [Candidatus Hydrogenedentes bacterium]|nr:hypothetical protein [Candidatus Hydrogenedentota bacterium]
MSRITPETFGGGAALYAVLKRIPQSLNLETLRSRYDFPDFDHEYTRYFGDVDAAHRPTSIDLRGPLLFGIAESERARHFPGALQGGDYSLAGKLMRWGHDGDRRIDRSGNLVQQPTDDAYLDKLTADATPIVQCPGAYGASSPALDRLVDTTLDHGALGASLTGAGIAGTVLALCRAEDAEVIAAGVREAMAGKPYQEAAGFSQPITTNELDRAVVVNHAVSGAGEIWLSA